MLFLKLLLAALLLFFLLAYVFYLIGFRRLYYNDITKPGALNGPPFASSAEMIREGIAFCRSYPTQEVSIRSYDGLTLRARYYDVENPRGTAILLHGYRSIAGNDFSCGLPYLIEQGFSVLLADQRAHGKSQGRTITFGVKERYDALAWARYAAARWPGRPLLLEGISMGAATVLMASDLDLPPEVRGILADCGYTSPEAIIKKVLRTYHAPVGPIWFLGRLGARLYGGFDPASASATEALRHTSLPVLFVHGEADDFVPCDMSRENFEACRSPIKHLVTVPLANHGMSFVVDKPKVTAAIASFLEEIL